jgi:hypothetical protein
MEGPIPDALRFSDTDLGDLRQAVESGDQQKLMNIVRILGYRIGMSDPNPAHVVGMKLQLLNVAVAAMGLGHENPALITVTATDAKREYQAWVRGEIKGLMAYIDTQFHVPGGSSGGT